MPNRRAAIVMTRVEVTDYLAAARTLVLVTNGRDGLPHPVPMWYEVDGDGRMCMRTYTSSQKVRNLSRDPRAAALVEDGTRYAELRGVQLVGRVELVRDAEWVADLSIRLLTKYEGLDPRHAKAIRAAALERAAKQTGLRMTVERVVSWDHGKQDDGAPPPSRTLRVGEGTA